MTRLRVRTPSRLHFGLLGWGPHAPRQFGGVGLMIEKPGLEILVETAARWEATARWPSGPWTSRDDREPTGRTRDLPSDRSASRTSHVPDAHVGLGVGTQLSLAVARAVDGIRRPPPNPGRDSRPTTGVADGPGSAFTGSPKAA